MRSAYLAAELTLAVLCVCIPDVDPPKTALKAEVDPVVDLTGIYSVSGMEGDKHYAGTSLVVRAGDSYVVISASAHVAEEGTSSFITRGTGLRRGDTFAVAWGPGDGKNGITVYTISPDGKRLSGEWTVTSAKSQRHKETLTRLAGLPGETQ
jgi:hypothetical protein